MHQISICYTINKTLQKAAGINYHQLSSHLSLITLACANIPLVCLELWSAEKTLAAAPHWVLSSPIFKWKIQKQQMQSGKEEHFSVCESRTVTFYITSRRSWTSDKRHCDTSKHSLLLRLLIVFIPRFSRFYSGLNSKSIRKNFKCCSSESFL